jgi:hypothetical protein
LQIFLNKERQAVPLKEKIQLSHDTFLYRFALPQKNSVLGLPVGKHFKIFSPNAVGSVKGQWNGQPVRCGATARIYPPHSVQLFNSLWILSRSVYSDSSTYTQDTEDGKEEIERKYTPTSSDDDLGPPNTGAH